MRVGRSGSRLAPLAPRVGRYIMVFSPPILSFSITYHSYHAFALLLLSARSSPSNILIHILIIIPVTLACAFWVSFP